MYRKLPHHHQGGAGTSGACCSMRQGSGPRTAYDKPVRSGLTRAPGICFLNSKRRTFKSFHEEIMAKPFSVESAADKVLDVTSENNARPNIWVFMFFSLLTISVVIIAYQDL